MLGVLARAKRTSGYSIVSAADAAEDRLFDLDNELRNQVRGTDGWSGDRAWFHQELSEAPPFDAAGYIVAVHETSGDYVGLVRVWRNPAGPRLGMVGVLAPHRSTTLAAMLLGQAWRGCVPVGFCHLPDRGVDRGPGPLSPGREIWRDEPGRFAQLTRS